MKAGLYKVYATSTTGAPRRRSRCVRPTRLVARGSRCRGSRGLRLRARPAPIRRAAPGAEEGGPAAGIVVLGSGDHQILIVASDFSATASEVRPSKGVEGNTSFTKIVNWRPL